MSSVEPGTPDSAPPLLRIVRGTPTPQELAAVIAVIAARSGGEDVQEAEPRSRWASYEAALRKPLHPGPGAWTASG